MKAIRVVLFVVTLLSAFSAQSSIYSYIYKSEGTPTNATYYWTLQYWDSNDPTPNPCYGWASCTIFIGHRHNPAGTAGVSVSDGKEYLDGAEKYATVGQLGGAFKNKYPLPRSGTQHHDSSNGVEIQECVGIFYKTMKGEWAGAHGSPMMRNSVCGIAPPPVGACKFQALSVELDHGNIQMQQVNGHQASKTVSVLCNQTMTVKVFAAGNAGHGLIDLRANGSLKSELAINGESGANGVNILANAGTEVPVKFTSTLQTNGSVAAGDFFGSSTVVLALP